MSSLDASDEMLRFMTTLIRTGMKDVNGVVNLPSNAIKRARENDQNRKWLGEKWRGNLDFIKNLYNHVRRTEKAVVNADTPQGRLEAINNSLLGSIIKIPGDNDKICFALKSSDTKEFAEYMKAHGDVSYVMSDMKIEDSSEPYKMVILDKGELNKAQDFLRGKGEILDGKNTYTIPKEFITAERQMYRELVKEVDIETQRDKALADNKLDKPIEHEAKTSITGETHTVSSVDVAHIDESREHILDKSIGSSEQSSLGFSQRSDENLQSKNGNLSGRSEQGLWINKNENRKKPRRSDRELGKSANDSINKDLRGLDRIKVSNRPVYGEQGLHFVRNIKSPLKEDFVFDASKIDASALNVFKASELDGFKLQDVGGKAYLCFNKKQIGEFLLTLSPETSKPLDKKNVLNALAVGDKRHIAREISKFELKRDNPEKPTSLHSMAKNKEYVKEKRDDMAKEAAKANEKADEMNKKLAEFITQALGKADLGKVADVGDVAR